MIELDLTACDIEREAALALAGALEHNTVLTTLRLSYNPALADAEKATLRAAAEKRVPPLSVDV